MKKILELLKSFIRKSKENQAKKKAERIHRQNELKQQKLKAQQQKEAERAAIAKQKADKKEALAKKKAAERDAIAKQKAAIEKQKAEKRAEIAKQKELEQKKRAEEKAEIERKRAEEKKKQEEAKAEAERKRAEEKAEADRKRAEAKAEADKKREEERQKQEAERAAKEAERKALEEKRLAEKKELEAKHAAEKAEAERKRLEEKEAADKLKKQEEEKKLAEKQALKEKQEAEKAAKKAAIEEAKQKAIDEKQAKKDKILADKKKAEDEKKALKEKQEADKAAKKAAADEAKQKAIEEKKKIAEDKKQAKLDKKKLQDNRSELKEQEREKKKAEKERAKLAAKRKQSSGKLNKKQAKLLHDLEESAKSGTSNIDEAELEQAKEELKNSTKKAKKVSKLSYSVSSKKLLIVNIREDFTHVAEIAISGAKYIETKRVTVADYFKFKTPTETFVNGTLTNIKLLALELMKELVKSGIKTRDVIWVSDESSILQRPVEDFPLQKDPKSNLEIVKGKAAEQFPVDLENYILRYKVLNTYLGSGEKEEEKPEISATADIKDLKGMFGGKKSNKMANIQIVAFPAQLQELYEQLGSLCNLNTKAIDYANNGMVNVMNREYKDSNAVCIEIESDYTTYYTVSQGLIISQSRINTGYKSMLNKILGYGDALLSSTPEGVWDKISKYKLLEFDFSRDTEQRDEIQAELGLSDDYIQELEYAMEDLRFSLESIIDKANSSMQEAERLLDNKDIEHVDIICAESEFPNLSEDFLNITKREVAYKNSYSWISLVDDAIDVNLLIHSIGSALDPINFKGSANKKENNKNKKVIDRISIGIIVFGILVAAGAFLYTDYQLKEAQKEKQHLTNRLESAHEAETIAKKARTSIDTVDKVTEFEEEGTNSDKLYDIICDLEQVLPKTAVVSTILSEEKMMSITVYTETRYDVIKFIEGLEELDYFNKIETFGIQKIDSANEVTSILGNYTVNINCYYAEADESK